jgi:hypothetical protein
MSIEEVQDRQEHIFQAVNRHQGENVREHRDTRAQMSESGKY